jgi:nitroreductase
MEFSELIRARYAVRAYQSRPVEEEALNSVLEAFALAPTAANRQAIGLVVVHTEGKSEDLRRIYSAEWFAHQAPLVLCACTIPARGWARRDGKSYADVDVAIAMDHAILAAADAGLGTCWIGAFDPQAAKEVLGLPDGVEPVALTPLGYSADNPRPKLRRSLDQLVHYETW